MVKIHGGDKLDAALAEIGKKLAKAGTLRVGFQDNSRYPDGTLVALVAAINEFGQTRIHPNQPPRPFFRNMINANSAAWGPALAELLRENNYDAEKTLSLLGEDIKGQLIDSINQFTTPGLAPSTIARKGFDKPLIDTGQMVNSITVEVDSETTDSAPAGREHGV